MCISDAAPLAAHMHATSPAGIQLCCCITTHSHTIDIAHTAVPHSTAHTAVPHSAFHRWLHWPEYRTVCCNTANSHTMCKATCQLRTAGHHMYPALPSSPCASSPCASSPCASNSLCHPTQQPPLLPPPPTEEGGRQVLHVPRQQEGGVRHLQR
jgi:hypothetical protein